MNAACALRALTRHYYNVKLGTANVIRESAQEILLTFLAANGHEDLVAEYERLTKRCEETLQRSRDRSRAARERAR